MKKKLIICMILTAVLFCVGCDKKEKETNGKLNVYYTENSEFYKTLLNGYDGIHNNLELTSFSNDDDMTTQLASDFASNKGPDVIFMDVDSSFDVYKAAMGNNLADMSSYFENDSEYNQELYNNDVIQGAQLDGRQYVMPLTYAQNFTITKKSTLEKLGLDELHFATNQECIQQMREIRNQLLEAFPEELETGLQSLSADNSLLSALILIDGIDVVDYNSKEVVITEDEMKEVCEDVISLEKEQSEKKADMQAKVNGNMAKGLELTNILTCTRCNLIYDYMGLKTIFEKVIDDEISYVHIDEGYNAEVINYAIVNQKCKNKQAAYELVKYAMNYNIPATTKSTFNQIKKSSSDTVFEDFKSANSVYYPVGKEKIYADIMDADTKKQLQEILASTNKVAIRNPKVISIVDNSISGYINGTVDFDSSYQDMVNKLKLYMYE